MTPTIVSFYTPGNDGGYYTRHADRMRAECAALGLECWIKEVDFSGRPWIDLLREKSAVIIDALEVLNTPVLWVDVDATILQRPKFIEQRLAESPSIDFMAVPKPPDHRRPFFMGCSFWNRTGPAIEFLRTWHEFHAIEDSEELAFQRAFEQCRASLKWAPLPAGYMALMWQQHATIMADTVVVHRASDGATKREYFARSAA